MTTKNKTHFDITNQLDSLGLLYEPLTNDDLADVKSRWTKKFVANHNAPDLDKYMWHVFSFNPGLCLHGDNAKSEYLKQHVTDFFIFNERLNFGVKCTRPSKLPDVQMTGFRDDIYICHHNLKWTYVITHETPDFGPYFAT